MHKITIMTVQLAYRHVDRSSIPVRVRVFLYSIASRPSLESTQPAIQRVAWALSLEAMQGGELTTDLH
jgi:hypothetical protein